MPVPRATAADRVANSSTAFAGRPGGVGREHPGEIVPGEAEVPLHADCQVYQRLFCHQDSGGEDLIGGVRPQVSKAAQGDVHLACRPDRARL